MISVLLFPFRAIAFVGSAVSWVIRFVIGAGVLASLGIGAWLYLGGG